jgi:excisionase family DNA binding protein
MQIHDLATHRSAYVSVGELADYWMVSRRYVYKQVEVGTLDAIRIGPRSSRIAKTAALEFQRRSKSLGTGDFQHS